MSGELNRRRAHAIAVSRSFKEVFGRVAVPRWFRALTGFLVKRWAYRKVFTADGAALRVAAQHVLADLRDFSFARTSAFDPDPIIMARRQGRRDVWLRISNYLNLDEAVVQQLMEIDDGTR